ncbi:FG-GAP-like repeat-containing protein, partial [Phaeodactylibacter xiamenensis]
DDKIAWYENDGSGNFGAQQVITTSADGASSVYAMDLDGDGDADVLSASLNDDKIAWYENDGSGNFGAQQVITTSADAARSVYAMDLDGDGDADVLSASSNDDKIAWYENECTTTQNCLSENTLQITTIQSAPPLVLDENGEWFTVYNPTDSVVDLNGYTILDDGTDSHSITTSLLLPAGGSITLGNNADTLTNGGVHIDYAYGSDITLDDEEDEIVLVCSGTEVARATYSGGLFAGCTNPTVALGADGTVSITPAQVEDGTMALDGLAGLWLDVTDFDCSNQGQDNPVELTVVDTDGDTSTCMAIVSVIDNMAPTAVCADVTIALDSAGMALLVADSLDGGSTDNCATSFTYEASQVAFSCDDLGEQSVTLTVSDGSPDAESGNCTATVTVVDDAAPVAECQDAAVQLDAAGMATLSPEAVNNGSYDNCTPAAGLVLEVSQDQFDCGDLGQQTVSLFVSDGSPNSGSGSCMAMVTVEDLLPPQAECTDVTVQLDENGTAFLPSFNVDGGSSDNCGTLDLALSQSSFDCTHLGENAVDMIVSDGSNNQDTCTATITVEDVISPVAVCQPFSVSLDSTGFASIMADNVDGGSTDNCAGVSLMLNQSTFDCGDIGTNTVTLTVTDASNNMDTCQATVTVTDDLPPQAICADISVALDSI